MVPERHTLSGSDVSIPLMGVGTWAWGDRSTWGMGGYDSDLTRDSIHEAWDASVVVATKFMPSPWKLQVRQALLKSLRASLGRLGLPAVDLYQIHGPISLRSQGALADALAAAHQEGLVKAVGVSNYSVKETRSIASALRKCGMQLATNQIE